MREPDPFRIEVSGDVEAASAMSSWLDMLIEQRRANPSPFRPVARYDPDGDGIELYLEDTTCSFRWYNPYLSIGFADDGRVVGVQLSGIKRIVEAGEADSVYVSKVPDTFKPAIAAWLAENPGADSERVAEVFNVSAKEAARVVAELTTEGEVRLKELLSES